MNDESKCPDGSCHQKVSDVHDVVFKTGGVRDCVTEIKRKKIPWAALTWIIPVFLVVVGTASGLIYTSYQHAQADQKERLTNCENNSAIQIEKMHGFEIAQKIIQNDLTHLSRTVEMEAERSKEVDKIILRKLENIAQQRNGD
jgi:hypothetical protein